MLGMGFVYNWSGLMAARWFLGVTEAGLFPGVNFYLSCWYKRTEFGIRAAIFFSAAALAGSFGGLLAAAIQNMDGIRGLAGKFEFGRQFHYARLIDSPQAGNGSSFWKVYSRFWLASRHSGWFTTFPTKRGSSQRTTGHAC